MFYWKKYLKVEKLFIHKTIDEINHTFIVDNNSF